MDAPDSSRCPVCKAAFRGRETCPRCGTDLAVLMHLAGRAHLDRQAARAAVRSGDLSAAAALARRAQGFCDTPAGRSLASFIDALAHVLTRLGTLE